MMQELSREQVKDDLLTMLKDWREEWEYAGEITEETGIFKDLEFESIDAVAFGSTIEEHFNQSLPFAEFLTEARREQLKDITVGDLLKFLMANLNGSQERHA